MTFILSQNCSALIGKQSCFGLPITCIRLSTAHTKIQRDEDGAIPRIRFPHKMVYHLEKSKAKQNERKRQAKSKKSKPLGPLLISCKRKAYNWHQNEKFDESETSKLVSLGWKNTKRVGDHFTLMPHSSNPSLMSEDAVTFENTGLSQDLSSALRQLGYDYPTNIQKYAIPSLLRGDNVICAAETGSGKTLAYLLPIIERLTQQKRIIEGQLKGRSDRVRHALLNNPHAVVITPSWELTEQVMSVAQSLSSFVPFEPRCAVGGSLRKSVKAEQSNSPMDILIATPGVLNKMLAADRVGRANLQSIVIDESDSLLDDSFVDDVQKIFHRLQVTPIESSTEGNPFLPGQQIALVSATMPRNLENALGHVISVDAMNKITTEDLHQLMPHVQQSFMRVKSSAKPEKLIHILKRNTEEKEVSIVFTNNNRTCYYVSKLLESNNLNCLWIHGEMSPKERKGVFLKFKEGYSDILVATDVVSRGLDTTNVHHVINYDFPTFISDYVHRVGRVGRVGSEHNGHATSFIATKWDVELLWRIEIAARKQKQLDNVNANIAKLLDLKKAKHDTFTLDVVSDNNIYNL